MKFVRRYLATAVAGTAAIYFGMPLLRPLLLPAAAGDAAAAGTAVSGTTGGVAVAAAGPRMRGRIAHPPRHPQERPAVPSPSATVSPPAAAPSTSPVIVVHERGYTPSTQVVPSSGPGVSHWGVTVAEAAVFTPEGRRMELTLPGGTLIEQRGLTRTADGKEMALCRVWRHNRWTGPYLIATADLLRFAGTREEVDAEQVDALCRYYALNGMLEARRRELQPSPLDSYPQGAELRKAYADYQAAAAQARELTARLDTAQGAERARIADELRRIKNEVPRLQQRIETLNRQYKEWKARQPSAAAGNPADDPLVREIEQEMAALRPRLEGWGV